MKALVFLLVCGALTACSDGPKAPRVPDDSPSARVPVNHAVPPGLQNGAAPR